MEPMPAGTKTDLLPAKAEKGEKTSAQLQPERGVRIRERKNSADTKVSEEGRGGGASST